tara:strand:- start:630 stop:1094 length:465 start_codon:yes stop_codon:yes gene_type:complete
MIKISHRGNLNGPEKDLENSPRQIQKVLKKGFECEVDVWYLNGSLTLAHNLKTDINHKINDKFIIQKGLWCHAKNLDALNYLNNLNVNYFWHEDDRLTITSKNWIWCHPDIKNSSKINNSIICLPEIKKKKLDYFSGFCSDFVENFSVKYKECL